MIRRLVVAAAVIAGASTALAQMPPSISKPIDAAKKAANATNAQTAQMNQQTAPAPAAQAKAPAPASKAPTTAAAKSTAPVTPAPKLQRGDSSKITFEREVFTYVPGEVDPFASPMETGAIRPLASDLKVVGIIYDAAGRNSVAVMRDQSTNLQYRAKVGQVLGRARVTQIRPQEVILSIEEYGFSRQTSLKLNVQQTQQTKGKP